MDNRMTERNSEMEIDIQKLLGAIWNKIWLVILSAVVGAAAAFAITFFLITPQYEASAMFYVNNNSLSVGEASFSITSSDISASKSLVDSYIVILKTRTSLESVIDYAGVDLTYDEVSDMITASAVNSTEIFEVVVTHPNPETAEAIADAIAYILPKRISSIIEGTSAKVVDPAVMPVKPSSPSYLINTMIGFVLGVSLTLSLIVLKVVFDITIRAEEDITRNDQPPVLAAVPDMSTPTKGGYYYQSGKQEQKKAAARGKQPVLVGSEISFAATEAYKLLRTKLQFSFTDGKDCHIIGISSALSGEGKSLSAVNLAYSLSQLNKRVLLIDCDMRRPSISAKLPITKAPGLSNYLSGQTGLDVLFQHCGIEGDENAFAVIAAGRTPPNPVELLSSEKMTRMLEFLRGSYDYILLDLPPVGEVTDALAVAKDTDGILLVVRQNYCNRVAYNAAVDQFQFIGTRILGVIYNCASENNGAYSKKYYQKSNGRGSYAASAARSKKNTAPKHSDETT